MYKKTLFFFIVLSIFFSNPFFAQDKNIWSEINAAQVTDVQFEKPELPKHYRLFSLNIDEIRNKLLRSAGKPGTDEEFLISFPDKSGNMATFSVKETQVMHPDLAKRYPDNRSFSGFSTQDHSVKIRFSINELGLYALIIDGNRKLTYIDPYSKDLKKYILYERRDIDFKTSGFRCFTKNNLDLKKAGDLAKSVDDKKLRIYRLAMASTGEYSQYHIAAAGLQSGTDAEKKAVVLAEMTMLLTRVNEVYENDLAISMQLISNTDDLIYLDAATDPYTNDDGNAMLTENQTTCDNVIGSANYDMGHVLSTGGGGIASRASVCTTASKARGVTGSDNPKGDYFYFDFVAHELGHQFGANHTFNGDAQNCGDDNRNDATAVEPGSGSTIMAYAGICSPQNVQSHSDFYFHTVSIDEIWNYVTSGFSTCGEKKILKSNLHVPVASAGTDYTIPRSTPYILKGQGSDADNDPITFCWEQIDHEVVGISIPPSSSQTVGAVYRSYTPVTGPERYMPALRTVIKGTTSSTWEVTPSVARTMNFALTVRDNNAEAGQVAKDEMTVTVTSKAGPFEVTSQNIDNVVWEKGKQEMILWDVAGTSDNGVNVSKVDIYLSTDGGKSFSTLIVGNTPNDGSEEITVPDLSASKCFVMVKAVDNLFYAINTKAFSIGQFTEKCLDFTAGDTPLGIPDNNLDGIVSLINIKEAFNIESTTISVNITHSWIADLTLTLISPSGTAVELIGSACFGQGNEDMDVVFDDNGATLVCGNTPPVISGVITPTQDLSVLNGESSEGIWKLKVVDDGDADVGTINSWSMNLCTSEPVLGTGDHELSGFNVYPNPSDGRFNIVFTSKETGDIKIGVFDLLGRKVEEKTFKDKGAVFNEKIDLSKLSGGLYILQVRRGNSGSSYKIYKK